MSLCPHCGELDGSTALHMAACERLAALETAVSGAGDTTYQDPPRFDENALGQAIARQWGFYGAHADVYREMRRELQRLRGSALSVEVQL